MSMNAAGRKIIILGIFVSAIEIHALDIKITGKEAEARLGWEYNRSYDFYGDISSVGAVEFDSLLKLKTGFSVGRARDITDIRLFTNARFRLPGKRPFGAGLLWMYNGLPGYEARSHAILPVIYYNAKYWGVTLGPCFRFTGYFNERAIFETTLSCGVYANFINNEKLRIGVSLANFNDFQARNFMSLSLCFDSDIRISRCWSLLNELELKQSGGDGLTAAFLGIAIRGGARFAW